jgi:UDP-GlcNAc:undecaprenyl-phosphate GlcNAc-1-phosphate transferase
MTFPFDMYLLAGAVSFLTTLLSLPAWRRWSQRVGLMDDPGHRKIHDQPTSLAGGLAVMTGLAAPLLAAGLALVLAAMAPERLLAWTDETTAQLLAYGYSKRAVQLLAILLGAVGMVALGCWDDRKELRPRTKFALQLAIAFGVAASGIRITLFVDNVFFSYAVTVLWILTITNAVNFLDNMNGLCAGLGAIATWYFAWSAAVHGQYLVALLAFLTCGALLGFLPYNFPRASVFLGDSGSHLVGYLLAVLAILPHFYSEETPNALAVLSPLLILAVPLFDLVSVVIIRWRQGKPFYLGDNNHISHRLVRRGFNRSSAVLLIWLTAALAGALAFI